LKITIRRLVHAASLTGLAVSMTAASAGQTSVRATFVSNPIPEPVALALIGGALFGLGIWRHKRVLH
jgi:uncharacterized membrane protein YedE/YeeE